MLNEIKHNNITWLNASYLSKEDKEQLLKEYSFHPLDMEDILEVAHPSKIEFYDKYILLILHFPYKRSGTKGRLGQSELNIFISKDYLVTLHDNNLVLVDEMFSKCVKNKSLRDFHMGKGTEQLLYIILDMFVDYLSGELRDMINKVDNLDEKIFTSNSKDLVERINILRRNLIVVQTMVKPQLTIYLELISTDHHFASVNLLSYWRNVHDRVLRIDERLDDYQELVEGLFSANESLVSHRLNDIIKLLTIFNIILLPLNLLASMYGMNLRLPLAHETDAFWIIVAIMLGTSFVLIAVFKRIRWL